MTPVNPPPQPVTPKAPSRWWHAADIFVVLFAVFWIVDWIPRFIQIEAGDDSFTYAFHYFNGKLAWGIDIFQNTAGPWSVIYFSQYYPDTLWLMLFGQSALAILVGLTVMRMLGGLENRLIRTIAALLAVTILSLGDIPDARIIFLALAAIALTPDFTRRRLDWLHFALMVALALGFLMKGTYIVVFVLILGYTVAAESRGRRLPLTSLLTVAALITLNDIAGQNLADLPVYALSTLDPVRGWSERFGEVGSIISLVAFLVFGLALWLVILASELKRFGTVWGIVTSLLYAAIMFGLYKQSFVRQDGDHVVRAFIALLPFSACYLAFRLPQLRAMIGTSLDSALVGSRVLGLQRPTFIALACFAAIVAAFFATHDPVSWSSDKATIASNRSQYIASLLTSGTQKYRYIHNLAIERIRNAIDLPLLEGSVAVYSHLQTLAIAYEFDLQPIPTSTPYVAMTPRSEGANKKYFEGTSAPDFVIMGDPLHSRQPTGLALLANYEPYYIVEHGLILKKTDPEQVVTTPFAEATFGWGENVSLPDSGGAPVWATIHYQRSLLNRIVGFFYQPAPVTLELLRGDEVLYSIRLVQALAAEGMIISPNFDSIATFAALDMAVGRRFLADQPVTSVRFVVGEDSNWLFPRGRSNQYVEPDIIVKLMRIEFPGAKTGTTAGTETIQALTRLLALKPSDSSSPKILTTDFGAVLAAPSFAPLRFRLQSGDQALKISYGLSGNDGASANFMVSLDMESDDDEAPALLWSSTISAGTNAESEKLIVPNRGGREASLVLSVQTFGDATPYWTDLVVSD